MLECPNIVTEEPCRVFGISSKMSSAFNNNYHYCHSGIKIKNNE